MKKRQWKKVLAAGSAVAAAAIVKKTCEVQAKKQRQKEAEEQLRKRRYGDRQAYILGDGLTGLAAAFYLMQDARFPAAQIHVYPGGDTEGQPSAWAEAGCSGTGQYFLDAKTCENLWELVRQPEAKGTVKCRLTGRGGKVLELDGLGLGRDERMLLGKLLMMGEAELEGQTIAQWFSDDRFFRTAFWFLWSRLYGVRENSGLLEFRRLLLRKVLYFGKLQDMDWAVPFSTAPQAGFQRELRELLARRGVQFEAGCRVTDVELEENSLRVTGLRVCQPDGERCQPVREEDLCILTDGDLSRWNTRGNWEQAPGEPPADQKPERDSFWALAAGKRPGLLGSPEVFLQSGGGEAVSFSMTFRRDLLRDRLEALAGEENKAGCERILGASPWGMRLFVPPQPGQDEPVVILGTGLYPERPGSYVKKPMTACTGQEVWWELLALLGASDPRSQMEPLDVETLRAPYFFAPFQPHAVGDRAPVLPMAGGNLALAGWFAEVPEEVPGSREQQVRSARMAVYGLLQVEKEISPVSPYRKDATILARAVQAVYR